jgi:inward rectifier potassium channel
MIKAPPPSHHRRQRRPRVSGFTIGAQEFIQNGLARFDLRDPYYFAVSLSWRRFFVLFLAAELTINTGFALLYLIQPGCIANTRPGAFGDVFFFSLETLATVGYGVMAPATTYGHLVSGVEILTGMMFTAIMTGLLFVRFSKPKARIVYAENPIVTTHNGQRTLMVRVGNARSNVLTDTRFTLHGLIPEVSAEGHKQRSIIELPMVRPHLPVFAILWTLMHVIDEDSPLHGIDADTMDERDLRLFITITARDHGTGQEVSDLRTYAGADIRFGVRYADAIRTSEGNRTTADYALIGVLEAES